MRRLVLVLAFAATPSFAADPPSIDKLIEQLGSKSFPERERATKALRERGPAALPALRNALKSKDEEVRKRAETLIPPLEIEEAMLPKRVTLKTDMQTVGSVLQEFSKQTGFKLGGTGADDRKLSLDLKDMPFWEALERIERQPGALISQWNEDRTPDFSLLLKTRVGRSSHLLVRGPFRLEATWIHEDRDIDLTRDDGDKTDERRHPLTLAVSVHAEPRITMLKISPAKLDEAVDSEGKSLLEPPAKTVTPKSKAATESFVAPGRGTFRGESLTSSDIRLRRASETAKTLKLVRGVVPVKMILMRKPVVVTNKILDASGTSFRAGTDSMQISRVTNQGGSFEVEIVVPREENSGRREWHERFHVEDSAGNKFRMNGRGTSSDGRTYRISMYFSPPFNKKEVGPPAKLVFDEWVIHDYDIPFEFKDVPLP
jgi:hypothetical protein